MFLLACGFASAFYYNHAKILSLPEFCSFFDPKNARPKVYVHEVADFVRYYTYVYILEHNKHIKLL
jgi:hypothetical protein